jgi:hypothetical protein
VETTIFGYISMKLSGLLLTLVAVARVAQGNLLEGLLEDKIHSKQWKLTKC